MNQSAAKRQSRKLPWKADLRLKLASATRAALITNREQLIQPNGARMQSVGFYFIVSAKAVRGRSRRHENIDRFPLD
jgi:hypothetical protein